MAWTAKLRDTPKRESGKWTVIIQYTDGTNVINKDYQFQSINVEQIKNAVRGEVKRLNDVDAEVPTLNAGDVIDITPPAVVTPIQTQEQIDAAAWFTDYEKLRKLVRLANAGLILMTDARIVTLQTTLKAGWKNAYLEGV